MKKIKLFFKQLFARKLYVVSSIAPDGSNSCQVWEVEKDTNNIVEALGIFEERSRELINLCEETIKNSKDVVSAIVIISKECKHANELYFCSMAVTKMHWDMEKPVNPLLEMLMSMRKK